MKTLIGSSRPLAISPVAASAATETKAYRPSFRLTPSSPVKDHAAGLLGDQSAIATSLDRFDPADKLSAQPMVEVNGIEPSTSCLQSRRSPN
jgi:hypothetical protein